MLLRAGHWLGRGSLLVEGFSLGETLECDARVERDTGAFLINASLKSQRGGARDFVIRVAGNEVGTYSLRIQVGAEVLTGSAKLDSAPNLGLLWNDAESVYATFSLFAISDGIGLRGFLRDGRNTFTWEIAFSEKRDMVKADNVVSLRGKGTGRHGPRGR
ncbi:MAG: hypothetical protein R3E82_12560 [Pseudomonadales bacterium]|nr:hypothetical protein [Pseudomonadales bacterium]